MTFEKAVSAAVCASFLLLASVAADASVVGKVIASFERDGATSLILESKVPLVPGSSVYVGEGLRATVGDELTTSPLAPPSPVRRYANDNEKLTIAGPSTGTVAAYYYSAALPDNEDVPQGALVNTDAAVKPSFLQVQIQDHYTFESKRYATVTARQGDRIMLNKGSLNGVKDRDLYKVFDKHGHYLGLVETWGVGDFQSSGVLYNRLEDFHRDVLSTEVGDKLKFIGQRKLFALGLMGGIRSSQDMVGDTKESTYGGGLLWNVTSRDGWGLEVLFGGFFRDGEGVKNGIRYARSAKFIAPTWIKKNFFYPSVVSPFLGVGAAFFTGTNKYQNLPAIDETAGTTTLSPMFGGGVEFFSGRFFRPRVEIRYIRGPKINAGGNTFDNASVFYSAGFLTTW